MEYTLRFGQNQLTFDCATGFFRVQRTAAGGEAEWCFDTCDPVLKDGGRSLLLKEAQRCTVTCYENVLAQELTAVYEGFVCAPQLRITVVLSLFADYFDVMYIPGSEELVVFMASFVGALVGFLWWNGFPASSYRYEPSHRKNHSHDQSGLC